MKMSLYQTIMAMNNKGKTMLVLVTILTLAVGITLSIIIPQQEVSAQNMTAGNKMTTTGNMTGDEAGNTTNPERSGGVSSVDQGQGSPSIAIGEKGVK